MRVKIEDRYGVGFRKYGTRGSIVMELWRLDVVLFQTGGKGGELVMALH